MSIFGGSFFARAIWSRKSHRPVHVLRVERADLRARHLARRRHRELRIDREVHVRVLEERAAAAAAPPARCSCPTCTSMKNSAVLRLRPRVDLVDHRVAHLQAIQAVLARARPAPPSTIRCSAGMHGMRRIRLRPARHLRVEHRRASRPSGTRRARPSSSTADCRRTRRCDSSGRSRPAAARASSPATSRSSTESGFVMLASATLSRRLRLGSSPRVAGSAARLAGSTVERAGRGAGGRPLRYPDPPGSSVPCRRHAAWGHCQRRQRPPAAQRWSTVRGRGRAPVWI